MFKLSKVIAFTVTVALLIFSTHAYGVLQDRELYFELPWYATLTNATGGSAAGLFDQNYQGYCTA